MSGGPDILPDSRPRDRRGAVHVLGKGTFVPVYCANCGRQYGMVPEKMITHVFALCDGKCSTVWGHVAHGWTDPDAKVRTDLAEAMRTDYGRLLTQVELYEALDHPKQSLAAVARDWAQRQRKEN